MKDHVDSSHLTKFDACRMNRDQVMDFETWFKTHTNISNVETASPKPYKLLKFFISLVTTVNGPSLTIIDNIDLLSYPSCAHG